ncbi:MAG: hypothetical protein AABX86_01270 [Nanoarchaeota archaeon]
MDQRSWMKLKESLKKLPLIDQRLTIEKELSTVGDPKIKQEMLQLLATFSPTPHLEHPIKQKKQEPWKSLGKSVDELALQPESTEAREERGREERRRFSEVKAQTPTLDTVVEETPVKKEEPVPVITYGAERPAYGKEESYKPAEWKPGGTPTETFKPEKTAQEQLEEATKSPAERELKKTEKYKRLGI